MAFLNFKNYTVGIFKYLKMKLSIYMSKIMEKVL